MRQELPLASGVVDVSLAILLVGCEPAYRDVNCWLSTRIASLFCRATT